MEVFKDGVVHSTTVDPEDVTIEVAGRYLLLAQAQILFNTGGPPALKTLLTSIRVNGSIVTQDVRQNFDNDGDISTLRVSDIRDLVAGDVLTVTVTPTFSVGSADVLGTSEAMTYIAMERMA